MVAPVTSFTEEAFTGFKRLHYRVASGPCHDACSAFRSLKIDIAGKHQAFAKAAGGVGHYPGSTENVGNAMAINAVIFDGDLPSGWKPRRQSNYRGLKPGQRAASPDQHTKAGKAILEEIGQLPLLPSSGRICDAIGFPQGLSYRKGDHTGMEALGLFETIKVGWLGDVFYVSLPDYDAIRARREADGYEVTTPPWTLLPGMELILKEEADLDFARAAAAKAAS